MKVVLFGGNGLLGQNVIQVVPDYVELFVFGLKKDPVIPGLKNYSILDITDKEKLQNEIKSIGPDWIINSAAMTNVDLCETEIKKCELLNRDAVKWMSETGIPMVHISTDYVFDGESGPYEELDDVHPLGVYGKTKLESEQVVIKQNENSILIRTMLLWGTGYKLRPSYVDFVRNNLMDNKEIKIVKDQFGNPTLAKDLAVVIWKLIEEKFSGLIHVSGSELVSRYEWALQVGKFFGLNIDLIKTCTTSELGQASKRPLKSGFVLDKLENTLDYKMKNIQQQLELVYL